LGAGEAEVYLDSELVVRQIRGNYRVRNTTLKSLYQQVRQLKSQFESFTITHLPRWHNAEADKLARAALRTGGVNKQPHIYYY